jgi:glycosyltransferase involved in cell wall biosynthesis
MSEVGLEYEVHLTLDACTDDSAEVVEPYLKKLPLFVTHHQQRKGYGKCLSEAIRKVSGTSQNPKRDYFVVLDADFSVDPVEIKEMAPGIERNVVLYLPDRLSASRNRVRLIKRFANRLAANILRRRGIEFSAGIDLLSTVRACRVQHLRRNMPRLDALNSLPEMRLRRFAVPCSILRCRTTREKPKYWISESRR